MAEAAMRDIAQAGEFSEGYTQTFPPKAVGVIPSLFGALQAIDGALWKNGLRLGIGPPELISMPHSAGVWNLTIRGKRLGFVVDERASRIDLQGPALDLLLMPPSVRSSPFSDLTARWTAPMPPREGIRLQPKP